MLWFLDNLIDFPVSHADGSDGVSVLDHLARRGDSPPYHVHHTEDECFHLIEGELVALVDGDTRRVRAGETVLLPKGVPHTYCVVSERARWLVVTTNGDFEAFVRNVSRPAEAEELPPHSGPPTPAQAAALAELAARHRIELVGPPLSLDVAQAA
jgi:quercetin dioxygenase-like cupin family protein